MSWPAPAPGMVLNYSFLWEREANQGREEGVKDRPCAIILVTQDRGEHKRVWVVPITHTQPVNANDAIEIPAQIKLRLQLDSSPSWVVITEFNEFVWPGPDVRPVGATGSPIYGFLPQKFYQHMLKCFSERRAHATKRT